MTRLAPCPLAQPATCARGGTQLAHYGEAEGAAAPNWRTTTTFPPQAVLRLAPRPTAQPSVPRERGTAQKTPRVRPCRVLLRCGSWLVDIEALRASLFWLEHDGFYL